MNLCKRLLALILCVLLIPVFLPEQVSAAENIDTEREVSLSISYQDGDTPLSGAEFDIYLVAVADESGELTVTEEFSGFPVNIQGENDEEWRALASTLEGYVLREDIPPTDSGMTDEQGMVTFPTEGKSLKAGLYLVLGHRHTQNGRRYDPAPFMVMLPGLDEEKDTRIYDVTVNAKYDSSEIPENPEDDTIDRKVLKVWEDDGHEKDRPKEITVQLLCDGEVYDTVILNEENNWRYTWTDLDNGCTWTVAEKEQEGYKAEITREGITFVVTNTYEEAVPDKPVPTTPSSPTKPRLPQTGQLWWPVPVLIAAGLLFVILGLIRRRGRTDEK